MTTDTTILDDLLDVLKAARKVQPVNEALVERLMADLRDFNGIDTVGVLTADVYQVARRRLAQGYSLADVAVMTGLARSTVGHIRSGRRKPRKRVMPAARVAAQVVCSA